MKWGSKVLAALAAVLLFSAAAQAGVVGYVQEASGDASIRCTDKAIRPALADAEVDASDTLVTGPGGRMQVMFLDKSVLALGENSELQVLSVMNAKGDGNYALSVLKGTMRMATSAVVSKNPERFVVESPLGVIGIRGTEFASVVAPGEETHALLKGGPVLYTTTQPLEGDWAQVRDELCAKAFQARDGYSKARQVYKDGSNISSVKRMDRKIADVDAIIEEHQCVPAAPEAQ